MFSAAPVIAAIFLICIQALSTIGADDGDIKLESNIQADFITFFKIGGLRHKRAAKANINGPAILRSLRPCCFWPAIITKVSYENCTRKANSTSTVIYDRMCYLDCGMKNATYINGTKVNYSLIATRFSKTSGITFPTAALQSVADCTAYVEKLNNTIPTPPPPSGVKTCNPIAALVWICLRQKFLLSTCARTAAQEESCAANFEKLKSFTPLDLLNQP